MLTLAGKIVSLTCSFRIYFASLQAGTSHSHPIYFPLPLLVISTGGAFDIIIITIILHVVIAAFLLFVEHYDLLPHFIVICIIT